MEDRVPGTSSSRTTPQPEATGHPPREGRGFWVLTCYGISGLVLFGILAYFFSQYIAH